MTKPHLAVSNEAPVEDPWAELLEVAREQGLLGFDGEDPDAGPPAPTYTRHPMLNPDFWFFTGGWVFTILPFTSFIPYNTFEPLLFAALILNSIGLACNLTRPATGVVVHEIRQRFAINIRLPWRMHIPTNAPLVERITW